MRKEVNHSMQWLPESKLVRFLTKTGSRRQLNNFAKQNPNNCIAKLLEEYGHSTFANAKHLSNDIVLILGG